MAFGIPPSQLSLSPQSYLQHRRARKSQDIQEAQYQRSRLDAADRFAESMVSKEADRKSRFAELEFQEEQKLIRDRAKTKASLLDDIAKTKAAQDKDVKDTGFKAALDNNDLRNIKAYEDLIRRTKYPDTVQAPMPQPQFQPAGAEGGYDTRLDQPAPIQEGRADIKDKFTEMYPYGTEGDQVLGTQEPETPIARELTLDEINQQVLEEAVAAKQAPKPAPKEEIPEAVKKSTYASEYRRKTVNIKNETKKRNYLDKEITKLEKSIKSKELNFNRARNKASLRAIKSQREKITKSLESNQTRIDEIGRLAEKEWEAKQEKIKPKRSKEYTNALNIASKAFNNFKDDDDFAEKKAYILQKLRLTFPERSVEINRVFGESNVF
jgi:hypothetical protein